MRFQGGFSMVREMGLEPIFILIKTVAALVYFNFSFPLSFPLLHKIKNPLPGVNQGGDQIIS